MTAKTAFKLILRCFKLHRHYSNPLNLSIVTEVFWIWIIKTVSKFRMCVVWLRPPLKRRIRKWAVVSGKKWTNKSVTHVLERIHARASSYQYNIMPPWRHVNNCFSYNSYDVTAAYLVSWKSTQSLIIGDYYHCFQTRAKTVIDRQSYVVFSYIFWIPTFLLGDCFLLEVIDVDRKLSRSWYSSVAFRHSGLQWINDNMIWRKFSWMFLFPSTGTSLPDLLLRKIVSS